MNHESHYSKLSIRLYIKLIFLKSRQSLQNILRLVNALTNSNWLSAN